MAQERVLLLYLRAGGGHIAAARAIERRIRASYTPEEVEVTALDAMPPRSLFWSTLFETGYRLVSHRFRSLWVGSMEITRFRHIRAIWNVIMTLLFQKNIAEAIETHNATRIVFLHCLLIAPTLYAVKRLGRNPAMITVVLDPFTAPEFWFKRTGGPVVVFSDRLVKTATCQFGLPAAQVCHFPVILKEEYDRPMSRSAVAAARRRLGFLPDSKVVLLAGGGEGLPHGERHAEALLSSDLDVEIAVVCGKDEGMRRRIERIAHRHPGRLVHIYGFVDFMFELMNIADVVVSKGGPATIMEALILDKPLIVSQYIYGQEKGNVEFVKKERLGFYIEDSRRIVEHIRALVSDPSVYDAYRKRIAALALRNGTREVVEFILGFQPPRKAIAPAPVPARLRDFVYLTPEGRPDLVRQLFAFLAARLGYDAYLRRRKA